MNALQKLCDSDFGKINRPYIDTRARFDRQPDTIVYIPFRTPKGVRL